MPRLLCPSSLGPKPKMLALSCGSAYELYDIKEFTPHGLTVEIILKML